MQDKYYARLKKEGFIDIEDHIQAQLSSEVAKDGTLIDADHGGRPLKKWTGTSQLINLTQDKLSDIIDTVLVQAAGLPIQSSFPTPVFSIEDRFSTHPEFMKACEFLCKHGNSVLTYLKIKTIWTAFIDGSSERDIASAVNVSPFTVHHTIVRLKEWMNTMSIEEQIPRETKVIIRPYDHETDGAFLFSTWRNSIWYENHKEPQTNKFHRVINKEIRDILRASKVKIACLDDDPNQIVAYAVMNDKTVEFVYVKIGYRKNGIAKILTKGFTHVAEPLTRIAKAIVTRKELKVR